MVTLNSNIVEEARTSMSNLEVFERMAEKIYTRTEVAKFGKIPENEAFVLEENINKRNEELYELLPILENHDTHFECTIGNRITGLKNLLKNKTPKNPFTEISTIQTIKLSYKSEGELKQTLLNKYITESEEHGKAVGTKIYYLTKMIENSKELIEKDIEKGMSKESAKGNIDTSMNKLYELLNSWQKENTKTRDKNEEVMNYKISPK